MTTAFTAACVQMRSGIDPQANIDQATRLIKEAVSAGAEYVQTPEMSNMVNGHRSSMMAALRDEASDPMLAQFRDLARAHKIFLHAGSLAIKNGETWRESNTYTGGQEAIAVDLPWARLGLTICYDVRFPYLYRGLAQAGCGILSAPACFTRQTGEAHWSVLHRARAIENGAFMISAAQAGVHEDGRETYGHSMIIDPWGRVLAEADDQIGIIVAQIDPAKVGEVRGRIPALKHTRNPKMPETAPA